MRANSRLWFLRLFLQGFIDLVANKICFHKINKISDQAMVEWDLLLNSKLDNVALI